MRDKFVGFLAIAIPVFLFLWIGWASVNHIQSSLKPQNSEIFVNLIVSGLILVIVECLIFFIIGSTLGWAKWLVLLCGVFAASHLLTEFVITVSKGDTELIAYTTAIVFPATTIVLFWLLMRAKFALTLKMILGAALFVYVAIYYWHVSLLHDPSGWGSTSGFVLFFWNCTLITLYYVMYLYRDLIEWFCNMPEF